MNPLQVLKQEMTRGAETRPLAHVKQAQRATRRLKTIARRLVRELGCKLSSADLEKHPTDLFLTAVRWRRREAPGQNPQPARRRGELQEVG